MLWFASNVVMCIRHAPGVHFPVLFHLQEAKAVRASRSAMQNVGEMERAVNSLQKYWREGGEGEGCPLPCTHPNPLPESNPLAYFGFIRFPLQQDGICSISLVPSVDGEQLGDG